MYPKIIFTLLFTFSAYSQLENNTIQLWPNGNPGGWVQEKPETSQTNGGVTRIRNINNPRITLYAPTATAKNSAVIICPGGGYGIEAIDLEGTEIAEFLAAKGFHAFLLRYRLPKKGDKRYAPALQDAQRAISIVKSQANQLGLKKVGIMGFSAGGHLSATTSAHAKNRTYESIDEIDKFSCAPDFVGLIYPAYLFKNKKTGELAPEVQVSKETVPTFLLQTSDDAISVETSVYYYLALKNHKVDAELHIYPKGPHGYGLRCGNKAVAAWPELFAKWLAKTVK